MNEILLPCPFCDDSNPMLEVEVRGNMIFVYVTCHGCYSRGPDVNTNYPPNTKKAIELWNTRAKGKQE